MARHRHSKPLGQKRALSLAQMAAILGNLRKDGRTMEYALCLMLRDTCLRGVDLLALRPSDMLDIRGNVRKRFTSLQRKNVRFSSRTRTVECELEEETRAALSEWLAQSHTDRLFPRTTSWLRMTIKAWVESIGLDGEHYAAHSFRRSLPSLVYAQTKDIEACRQLLGHASLDVTHAYLGVTRDMAFAAKRAVLEGHKSP